MSAKRTRRSAPRNVGARLGEAYTSVEALRELLPSVEDAIAMAKHVEGTAADEALRDALQLASDRAFELRQIATTLDNRLAGISRSVQRGE